MISGISDQRRKLTQQDYERIQYQNNMGYTIRAIAGEHNISTKYVKKILNGAEVTVEWYSLYQHDCSGCGRHFTFSGIAEHFAIWTSGGNQLSCFTIMPGFHQ